MCRLGAKECGCFGKELFSDKEQVFGQPKCVSSAQVYTNPVIFCQRLRSQEKLHQKQGATCFHLRIIGHAVSKLWPLDKLLVEHIKLHLRNYGRLQRVDKKHNTYLIDKTVMFHFLRLLGAANARSFTGVLLLVLPFLYSSNAWADAWVYVWGRKKLEKKIYSACAEEQHNRQKALNSSTPKAADEWNITVTVPSMLH